MLDETVFRGSKLCVVGNICRDVKTAPLCPDDRLFHDGETPTDSIVETIGGGGANSALFCGRTRRRDAVCRQGGRRRARRKTGTGFDRTRSRRRSSAATPRCKPAIPWSSLIRTDAAISSAISRTTTPSLSPTSILGCWPTAGICCAPTSGSPSRCWPAATHRFCKRHATAGWRRRWT